MTKKILSILLFTLISLVLFSCKSNENLVNNKDYEVKETAVELLEEENDKEPYFEIHYLDVGQGDSALVMCNNHYMLIDGGSSDKSSLIYSYLEKYNIDYLDYIICTHPDEDHVGGLAGALNYADYGLAFSPGEKDTRAYNSYKKYVEKDNNNIICPSTGDLYNLGDATFNVLSVNAGDDNDSSIVIKINYGETSFLFTGDAEIITEGYLLNNCVDVSCDVLKVAHHGSNNSTSLPFLEACNPEYAVISVGKGNSFGHPTIDVLQRLFDLNISLYRTDIQGNIICKSDGENILFSVEKNQLANPYEELSIDKTITKSIDNSADNNQSDEQIGYVYCLNTNSKKFHYAYCSSVDDMKDENKLFTNDDRDTIISQGYQPCKRCNP